MELSEISRSLADMVSRVAPSVVTIFAVVPRLDAFLQLRPVEGVGSGFVVGEDGLLVTNFHVVGGASRIRILFPDGEAGWARVVAADPYRDLALLRSERRGLRPLKLGDSDRLRVGDLVFAVGSPLGMPGPTVTMGVVSATGRSIVGEKVFLEDLIQTDAAINPGNSGGPLVNAEGEAVGVTTAVIPYAQGIGFAIPINTVKRFITMVERYGKPLRAWIGIYVAQITPHVSSAYNLPVKEGLIVVRVVPGTPAHSAGIKQGDIIVSVNNLKVSKPRDLRRAVEDSIDKGDVTLEILRKEKRHTVKVPIMVEGLY